MSTRSTGSGDTSRSDPALRPDTTSRSDPAGDIARRLLGGDRRALARVITLVENQAPLGAEVVSAIFSHTGRAAVVGVTGPPGVGKSTLIAALVKRERARERMVGVLTVDPSSPFTHGALLGDRIRLGEHFLDRGVFIRSMASRGADGGLSDAALQAVLLMDAAGHELVLMETVGVGQLEIGVADRADTVILVLMPGSGDAVQALKAGVMEIPDVIVVNKSDSALTDAFIRELHSVLRLADVSRGGWPVPLIRTRADTGEGVDELLAGIDAHRAWLLASGTLAARRTRNLRNEALTLAVARLRVALEAAVTTDPALQAVLGRVAARELAPADAARLIADARRGRGGA